jgi:LysR family hydrogen peroxide-inducible transcriptional activator
MTLQELRYLVAVADTASFSEAAAKCFVTQPTLSTQMKKLEQHLGARLFERTNKSVHVTTVGAKIVERARLVLAECDSIAELARTHRDPYAEPFRLGIISTLGPYLLPRLLPATEKNLPRLKLVIQEGLTADLLGRLSNHALDCVLLALPVSEPSLCQTVVFEEPFWLACRRDHPLAKKRLVRETDLAGHTVLLLSEGHCLRDQALTLCRQNYAADFDRDDSYRATSLETLRHLVGAGFGYTLLPALALKEELRKGAPVKAVRFDSSKARRRIGLIWRRGYPRAAALEEFAKVIRRSSVAWMQGKGGAK